MANGATVLQLNVSRGGVPKLPVLEAEVGERGMAGDRQRDLRVHGGPERALCLWSAELIGVLRAEGHAIAPGSAGENVTTAGLDWPRVLPGARLRLGAGVLIEITSYAGPCKSNARWFADGDFNRINQATHPGWSRVYARVLAGGVLHPGDPIALIEESAAARVQRVQPRTVRWRPQIG